MSSNRIKSLALATAIATCAGVGLPSMADAHYRGGLHYGWHSGWHKDWHAHRGWARYGYARPAPYASMAVMAGPWAPQPMAARQPIMAMLANRPRAVWGWGPRF